MGLGNVTMWIRWLAATAVAAVAMSSHVYSNFQTLERAKEDKTEIRQELSEIKADIKELLKASKK